MEHLNKILITGLLFSLFSAGLLVAQHEDEVYEVKPKELSDGTLYGSDLNDALQVTSMSQLFEDPSKFEKQTVKTEGTVSEVCQSMGCWIVITDGTNSLRVMTLHKFFMPKDLGNVKAVVEGEYGVKEITEEQAKHYEKESGKKSDKEIIGPQKMHYIKTTGVKILK